MIHFSNVSKRFSQTGDALQDVSLQIDAGEFVFHTGHSGAGKSTLLKIIALMERVTKGQVIVGGLNLGQIPRAKVPLYRRNIGMVFQNHRLLMDRTVFNNVALPMVIAGHRHQDIARRVRAALDKVGLLRKENSLPVQLSGGEQQRVEIGRAHV